MTLNLQYRVDKMFQRFRNRGWMQSVVKLAHVTYIGADPPSGDPGTPTITYDPEISPRPMLDLRDQYRAPGGMTTHVGDGRLAAARDSVTRAQLLAAAWIDIDGEKYTVVMGETELQSFMWLIMIKRMQA